jgi:hypothetical protein
MRQTDARVQVVTDSTRIRCISLILSQTAMSVIRMIKLWLGKENVPQHCKCAGGRTAIDKEKNHLQ